MRKLFFDIETIPDQREGAIDRYLADVKPPGQYKKQESIQKWIDENAEAVAVENWKKSALHGIAGEVCSIAWAFDDGPVLCATGNDNKSESAVLANFFSSLCEEARVGEGRYPNFLWIGHNVIDFDIRYLYQRMVINGIDPSIKIPIDERYNGKHVFDTMKAWGGWRDMVKLDALVDAFGLKYEEEQGIDGSQVWDLYQSGQYNTITQYNKLDVEKTRDVYRRLTWES